MSTFYILASHCKTWACSCKKAQILCTKFCGCVNRPCLNMWNDIFNVAEEQDKNKPNYEDKDDNFKTFLSLYWTIFIAYPWLLLWRKVYLNCKWNGIFIQFWKANNFQVTFAVFFPSVNIENSWMLKKKKLLIFFKKLRFSFWFMIYHIQVLG